jgi:serine/threonine protein kinase
MGTSPAADGGVLPSGVRPLRADDPAELGGNVLVGRLGSGGMGVVYLARDPLTDLVAVKSAHGVVADEELTRRFAAEVDCLRRVPDACTARLIADGTRRTPPYIVTEYVEGRSLEHLVETGGPLPPEQVRALATGVGRALAAIHEAGLIHRDLKPANILLTPAGPRVIDFGIAHKVGATGGPTIPGMVVGSPGWIAPERLNQRPATPASDVFGWGCLVGYAATGHNPFGGGDLEAVAERVLNEPPDLDGLEEPVRGLVEQAVAKDPAVRPSAGDLLARLISGAESVPAGEDVRGDDGARGTEGAPSGESASGGAERRVADTGAAKAAKGPEDPPKAWRRWPAVTGAAVTTAAVTAAAALVAVIATTAADHDTVRTRPSDKQPAPPPASRSTPATTTPRLPVARERSGLPRPTPSAPTASPVPKPSASSTPIVSVPGLIDSALPGVGKGVGAHGR